MKREKQIKKWNVINFNESLLKLWCFSGYSSVESILFSICISPAWWVCVYWCSKSRILNFIIRNINKLLMKYCIKGVFWEITKGLKNSKQIKCWCKAIFENRSWCVWTTISLIGKLSWCFIQYLSGFNFNKMLDEL